MASESDGLSGMEGNSGGQVYQLDENALNTQQRLAELEGDLREMKKHAEQARTRKWWKDLTIVLSVTTFCFSLLTTLYNYRLADEQNIHNARVELRGILQRITEINREMITASESMSSASLDSSDTSKYRVGASFNTMSALQTENVLLADQAAYLIKNVLHGDVTPGEYTTLGFTYQSLGLNQQALEFYRAAEARISNLNDALTTFRSIATVYFMMGNVEEGRVYYQKAMEINQLFPVENPYYLEQIFWQTEVQWVQAELSRSQCDQARAHFTGSLEHARRLGVAGFPNVYENQVVAMQPLLDGCKPQPLMEVPQVPMTAGPPAVNTVRDMRAILLILLHHLNGGW